jgi:multidrug efflux system membrane fusion protein
VPQAAIQRGTQGAFVYAVQADSTVSIRPVQLGPVSGEQIVVERGLAPGEQIVIDGADKLREGAAIEAIAPVDTQATQQPQHTTGEHRGKRRRNEPAAS